MSAPERADAPARPRAGASAERATDAAAPRAVAEPTRLITASLARDPVLDVALGSALLQQAPLSAAPLFRLGRPAPTISFGRLDRILPGFPAAAAAARAHGFTPSLRVGGGRAAAIHEGALSFGIAMAAVGEGAPGPSAEPALAAPGASTAARFAWLAELVQGALARVGVAAQRGQLPDEYCPGDWSLHAGGIKLAGLSQRVRRDATWTEGLLLVTDGARARTVLEAVHAALDLPLDPTTVGAVEDLVPGVTVEQVAEAFRNELAARGPLADWPLDAPTLAAAEHLRERHAVA